MRFLIIVGSLLLVSTTATAQMVSGESIGNDPAKERLCILRSDSLVGKAERVPFEMDSRYLARARKEHPDVTFVALGDSLVTCFQRPGTGRYEPDSAGGENWYWHLIKPKQFHPGYSTNEGDRAATAACLTAASEKTKRLSFDHSMHFAALEVGAAGINGGLYHAGVLIGGTKAEHYDIVLNGTLFFKSTGPDLAATKFTCLLSPMLEFKAIEFK